MEKIQSFSIFKNTKKEKETQPDYKLSAKINDEYVEIGAGWIKDGKSGKFISVQLKKPYDGKSGYFIEIEKDTISPVIPKFERDSKGNPIGEDKPITAEDINF